MWIYGVCLMAWAAQADANHEQANAQALDLAKQAIALRSVRGPGNQAQYQEPKID